MNKLLQIKKKRKEIAFELYNGVCYVCQKKWGRGFAFHHINYRNGELIHSDFRNWIDYNNYIIPIIQKLPNEFALLCITCHRLISILQRIKSDLRFERLVDLARNSRK